MALIKCLECGEDVSESAEKCARCGAAKKKGSLTWLWVIFGLLFIYSALKGCVSGDVVNKPGALSNSSSISEVKLNVMDRQSAAGACMTLIKRNLHDPDSATFDSSKDATVFIHLNKAYVVRSVRAKNGFGAMRLQEYECLLSIKDDDISVFYLGVRGEKNSEVRQILKEWGMMGK